MMNTNHDAARIVHHGIDLTTTRSTIADGCTPKTKSAEHRACPQHQAADIQRWLLSLDAPDILGVEEHLLYLENLLDEEREQTRELHTAKSSKDPLRVKSTKSTTHHPRASSSLSQGSLTTKQVCTKFREGHEICEDPKCRKLHIFPKKDCRNESYLQCGICSNWSKCRSRHPWSVSKWGDKNDAYEKFKAKQKEIKSAEKSSENSENSKPRSKANLKKTKEINANKILRMIACQ